jgi:hypothetical protein
MRFPHIFLTAVLAATLTLTAGLALGGWGDALKSAGEIGKAAGLSFSSLEADSAIKEVLTLGKDYAIETLGKDGGFSDNVAAAISLPGSLSSLIGKSGLTSTLNSAAEDAVLSLDGIFDKTIEGMDVSDPTALLESRDSTTFITDYFEGQARPTLKELAIPFVKKSLENAGMSSYTTAISAISQTTGFDPVDYTTDQTLDAVFHYMGEKEKSLRESGGEGASTLLQKVL